MAPPHPCWPKPELGSCPQGAVQAGQLKVPPGYHPLDVEKEWGKLHVAILEREKQLRTEFERWAALGLGGCGWLGGALWWWGSHPPVSHCLGRKSPRGRETHSQASEAAACRLASGEARSSRALLFG